MTNYDAIVVGSGPGGAAVARNLARGGWRVLICERGRDWRGHPLYGTYLGPLLYADHSALRFTAEGMQLVRPMMVGGATSMYAGCAWAPEPWWESEYGIRLEGFTADIVRELEVKPLSAELRGAVSTRLAEAGTALGMAWQPQDKFMQPARSREFTCGAHCMLGCRCGAKWNAGEWIDDAVAAGAELRTRAVVQEVETADGVATGVRGRWQGRPFTATAPVVVLAGGGIGTPPLLQRAGIAAAARGLAMDATVIVYGAGPASEASQSRESPMTWSYADAELGVLFSTLIDPWLMFPLSVMRAGASELLRWPKYRRTMGIMIKLADEVSGAVRSDGRVEKGITEGDSARLERAQARAVDILRKAGARADSCIVSPLRGTHPSASARIGSVVDSDLRTEIDGLYVCDASVFPRALGRPTVLTILALGQRLAEHLQAPLAQKPAGPHIQPLAN